MTWIYSSLAWRGDWSAEPQTRAVPCGGVAVPVFLSQAGLSTPGAVGITFTQGLSSIIPHLSPQSELFSLFKKVTKINLKVSFFFFVT